MMEFFATIPNLDASVDWWTTAAAARDFWFAFAGVAAAIWAGLSLRNRTRVRR
jgi:hypothetical protein